MAQIKCFSVSDIKLETLLFLWRWLASRTHGKTNQSDKWYLYDASQIKTKQNKTFQGLAHIKQCQYDTNQQTNKNNNNKKQASKQTKKLINTHKNMQLHNNTNTTLYNFNNSAPPPPHTHTHTHIHSRMNAHTRTHIPTRAEIVHWKWQDFIQWKRKGRFLSLDLKVAIQAVCGSDLWWERYWHGHSLPHPYHHPLHHHSLPLPNHYTLSKFYYCPPPPFSLPPPPPPPPPSQRPCPITSPNLLAPAFLSSSPGYRGLLIPARLGQEGQLTLHHLVGRNGATWEAWTPPTWLGSAASLTSRSCLSASRFSTRTPSPAETRPLNCRTLLMRATLISSFSLRLGLRLWVMRSNCKSWFPRVCNSILSTQKPSSRWNSSLVPWHSSQLCHHFKQGAQCWVIWIWWDPGELHWSISYCLVPLQTPTQKKELAENHPVHVGISWSCHQVSETGRAWRHQPSFWLRLWPQREITEVTLSNPSPRPTHQRSNPPHWAHTGLVDCKWRHQHPGHRSGW